MLRSSTLSIEGGCLCFALCLRMGFSGWAVVPMRMFLRMCGGYPRAGGQAGRGPPATVVGPESGPASAVGSFEAMIFYVRGGVCSFVIPEWAFKELVGESQNLAV